ncbi:MAG: response regulator [Phycisphaeraceae bacterium]|nr:response regulator [Phycisphaeraceae bacterium]
MHSILLRHLDKLGLEKDSIPSSAERWMQFLSAMDRAFVQFESDRQFHERSMTIASEEMAELHRSLAAQNATLECLVSERTTQLNSALQKAQAINADLESAKSVAESANRAKSEFLAAMSHEIRTPLNGIVGTLELLQTVSLNEKQRRYIQIGKTSARSLNSVINDILDFSKIEAGKLELSPIQFNLRGVIEDVMEMLAGAASEKHLQVSGKLSSDVPEVAFGDPDRLRQIIINLVNNAIKFTSRGSVMLQVGMGARGRDGVPRVRFEVSDTGIGIPKERLNRLFKAFSQADASTTRTYGGTGLGLAISKQLVELMGGSIGVRSEAGKGSTFWFEANLLCPGASEPTRNKAIDVDVSAACSKSPPVTGDVQADHASVEVTDNSRARVLLVEDNEVNQLIAREMLLEAGFECDVVSNGNAAVTAVKEAAFDIVLMDCQMPEKDGFEATREIRKLEQKCLLPAQRGRNLHIIALTANALKGDRERCLEAGMDAYTSKPIDRQQLLATIENVLRVPRQTVEPHSL